MDNGQVDPNNDAIRESLSRSRRIGIALVLVGVFLLFLLLSLKARWQGARIQVIPAGTPADSMKLDLNSATEGQLMQLPGVGPSLAKRIVESRQADGPFPSIQALSRVRGFGPKTVEQVFPYISASSPALGLE